MATPLRVIPVATTMCVMVSLIACAAPDTGPAPTAPSLVERSASRIGGLVVLQTATGLPAWIVEPSALPPGTVGKNSCTFSLGPNVPQWDFHADAGCWEHAGPDGWTRQQFERIHIPSSPACGGGPGDVAAVRICKAGGLGQPSPCPLGPVTGPSGCAPCVSDTTCH
jgi:hypothetical protein